MSGWSVLTQTVLFWDFTRSEHRVNSNLKAEHLCNKLSKYVDLREGQVKCRGRKKGWMHKGNHRGGNKLGEQGNIKTGRNVRRENPTKCSRKLDRNENT